MLGKLFSKMTYTRIIALGFLLIIALGTLLLTLPIASRAGEWTPIIDAWFTATSATCVTGLIVFDTFVHWSLFGQLVIIVLIQIGGLGLMTVIATMSIFTKRKIGLHERRLLMQSAGTMRLSGVVLLIKRIARGTFMVEGLGAALLAIRFCPRMGAAKGIYYSIFHSISAFCNAGFDIMGYSGEYSSFTGYSQDALVLLTLSALIVTGGVGFIVWSDFLAHGFRFKKYELHSKIVLSTTAALVLGGWVLFMISERGAAMDGMSLPQRLLAAFFQSVTARTAGFDSLGMARLSEAGSLLMITLMLIGGSPGSTAGGMKTTTFFVLIAGMISCVKSGRHITVFKRRLEDGVIKQACAIIVIYLTALVGATLLICLAEPYSIKQVLFEAASAVGTVGLSTGITPALTVFSKLILMALMYVGRVGGFTFMLVLAGKGKSNFAVRPCEKILIG